MGADVLLLLGAVIGLVIEIAFLRVRVVRCQRGIEAYRDVLRAQLQANEKVKVFLDTSARESAAQREWTGKLAQTLSDLAVASTRLAETVRQLQHQHQELRSSCEAIWRLQ